MTFLKTKKDVWIRVNTYESSDDGKQKLQFNGK